ncbi:hypothetical protein DFH05DRAFT_1540096 [Lentinula detonsa]|uniref:Fungal-type protein kinase domain-containing protein n=1 Tax=Lentinula detonsa TaxID=2804962 RepID=A0A9W8P827_9AGAR|nr:hypothetical protein DFH05DRAFT_1540096 [Lentinula detonsa]
MVELWEAFQSHQRTAVVLDHFDHELNVVLVGVQTEDGHFLFLLDGVIRTCIPWLDRIPGRYGCFIIEHTGTDVDQAIDSLARWRHNIDIISELFRNDVPQQQGPLIATLNTLAVSMDFHDGAYRHYNSKIRFHTPEPATQPPTQQLPQHPESSSAQAQPISFHTPVQEIKAATSGAFRSASNVEERRTIIVSRDVPKMILEISLQDHLFHVCLPVPQSLGGQVDNILKILEDNGTIDIPNDRWVAFPVDPGQATGQEGAVFQVNGNVAMYSDRGVSSRPDGFNKIYTKSQGREQSEQKREWTGDVFKLGSAEKDENDDFAKLVYDMEQILALDPCRRFTFGTTIENCTTRLWFLSRATVLRTKPFDFMQNFPILSVLISGSDQLGFNHHLVPRRQIRSTAIPNQDQRPIDVLPGKVKDSSANIRVFKDVWLESDRLEEHKIRGANLADAKALNEEDGYDAQLEKHMLRPMAYWRVPVGDEEDDTGSVSVAMSIPSDKDSVFRSGTAAIDQNSDGIHQNKRPRPQRAILDRVFENDTQQQASLHHRHITGSCLSNAPQLSRMNEVYPTAFARYSKSSKVHEADSGWVHRDISSGNVCWFDDDHRGRIGDFEYATRMADRGRHNVRTVPITCFPSRCSEPNVLSLLGNSVFHGSRDPGSQILGNRKLKDNAHKKIDFDLVKKSVSKTRVAVPIVPFAHNPLHDLESVWWIIVYALFSNDDGSKNANDPMRRQMTM